MTFHVSCRNANDCVIEGSRVKAVKETWLVKRSLGYDNVVVERVCV